MQDVDSTLGAQRRRKQKNQDEEEEELLAPKKDSNSSKDPIQWFGLLVPNALRQTQQSFVRALDLSLECTNIQSEIQSCIARNKYLSEHLLECQMMNVVQ